MVDGASPSLANGSEQAPGHAPPDIAPRIEAPAPARSPFLSAIVVTSAVVTAVALFGAVFLLGPALLMALLALVLATAALPAVDGLGRFLPRHLATLVVLGAGLVVVVAAVAFAIPHLSTQFASLVDRLPARCQALKTWTGNGSQGGLARQMVGGLLPASCQGIIASLPKRVAAWQSLVWAENALWSILVVGAMAYWWILERSVLLMHLNLLFRPHARERARSFFAETEVRLGAFIRGQLVICALVGVATFAVYMVIGLPAPLALAGLSAVAELVPVVGPPVAAAAAVVSAPSDWVPIVATAVVVRALVDYLVTPLVMGRAVGVNALLVIVSLVALAKFGGVPGAMVAVPFAAIVQLAVDHWILNAPADRADSGRDRLSALRYQATALGVGARKLARHRARERQVVEIEEEVELIAEGLASCLRRVDPIDERELRSP